MCQFSFMLLGTWRVRCYNVGNSEGLKTKTVKQGWTAMFESLLEKS